MNLSNKFVMGTSALALTLLCFAPLVARANPARPTNPPCYTGAATGSQQPIKNPQVYVDSCEGGTITLECIGGWGYDTTTAKWSSNRCHVPGGTRDGYFLQGVSYGTVTPPDGFYEGGKIAN